MTQNYTIYRLPLIISLLVFLSGCAAALPIAGGYAMSAGIAKAHEKGQHNTNKPKSINLTEESGIITVILETKTGGLVSNNQHTPKWAMAAAVVKAEQLGCEKIKVVPVSDVKTGFTPLGGITGFKLTQTSVYECLKAGEEGYGENIKKQMIIYKDYIEVIKKDKLVAAS